MKPALILIALASAILLTGGQSYRQAKGTLGLEFEELSKKRTTIRNGTIPILDLELGITNTNKKPIWLGTVGDYVPSEYLKERNPSNLRYKLRREKNGKWVSVTGGYHGTESGVVMLKPNESITITLPLGDRFMKDSQSVKILFDVSKDKTGDHIHAVLTPPFKLIGEQGEDPNRDGAPDE